MSGCIVNVMKTRYIQFAQSHLSELKVSGLLRTPKVNEKPQGVTTQIQGQEKIIFCSNDYLGLNHHPEISKALHEGIDLYGAGSGASHLISGHIRAHDLLEKKLAATQTYFEQAQCLFFSTGYMANLAAVTAFVALETNTHIFSEELNHASLIDAVRLAQRQTNTQTSIFPHKDYQVLNQLLGESKSASKIIVSDGVFSMDGDACDARSLIELAVKHDALLILDDAHGFGVLGEHGHGILDQSELHQLARQHKDRIIYIGTLGKAAGISGAFVIGHPDLIQWMIQKARPYIYTTASPAFIAHGLLKSIQLIGEDSLRERLFSNIAYWKKHLQLKHWTLMPSNTAIQPILIGNNSMALDASSLLDAAGFWVSAIRPPTVAPGSERLRVTLSASHTKEQIEALINTLLSVEQRLAS